jgi:protein ImuA
LRILKRRGPPLESPVPLPAHSARVAALLEARKGRGARQAPPAPAWVRRSHVLDRTATYT